jgi:hypothetical protein
MSDIYYTLDEQWKNILQSYINTEYVCTRCEVKYKEIDEIGKWSCYQHVLDFNGDKRGENFGKNVYDCCGQSRPGLSITSPYGCVRADHTALNVPYTQDHDVPVPWMLLDLFTAGTEAVVEDGYKGKLQSSVVIRRYDWRETAKRTNGHYTDQSYTPHVDNRYNKYGFYN